MTLEGAINFNETNDYTIYTVNSTTAGQYCVVLPKNTNGMYNMLVDLHMKSLFDGVNSGSKTKDDLIGDITKEYNSIKTKYNDAILVIPMFDETNYVNIITNDDKQKMFDEVKKIGAITSELYKKLTSGGIDKQKIDQKIIIIEKNDYDKKFVEWLIGQMPNFVSGVSMSEFEVNNVNPFMTNENTINNVNNIFGAPIVEGANVASSASESVTIPEANIQNNGVFGNVSPVDFSASPVVEQSVQQPVNAQVEVPNIFGEQSVQQPTPAPVIEQPVQQPVIEAQPIAEPKPVQSVELDKTVTFSPINENNVNSVPPVQPVQQPINTNPIDNGNVGTIQTGAVVGDGQVTKKSNGFVNLAILLVVLVGVTLVSIELGKFLYNTYGV